MKLAEQLKKERKKKHWNQEKLAKELYVTRQTISNWERGISTPDEVSIEKIENLFEISLERTSAPSLKKETAETSAVVKDTSEKNHAKNFRLEYLLLIGIAVSAFLPVFGMILSIFFIYKNKPENRYSKLITIMGTIAFISASFTTYTTLGSYFGWGQVEVIQNENFESDDIELIDTEPIEDPETDNEEEDDIVTDE